MTADLPTPPPGTWWEVTGTPQGPWTWTSESFYKMDPNGFAVSVDFYAAATAPGAIAVWRYAGDGRGLTQ
jgi:hypothetical protein